MTQLKKLFEPFTVGSMTLKNRMTLFPLQQQGLSYQKYRDYTLEIAKGGCALIVVTTVAQKRRDDASIRFLRELAEAVHVYDAKICGHTGTGYGLGEAYDEPVAASEGVIPMIRREARAITIEEIHRYVEDCGDIARRCYDAGFDAFELHIGMGYLLNRFLSPCSNRRTDEYGGSMENRMRMTMECIEAIRSKTPRDFPLLCRFTPEEFMPGGLTWNDWKIMAPIMDDAGIDIWSSQPGWHECRTPLVQNSVTPWTFLYLAEELKKVVKGPVIAGYRICDPLVAEQILAEGRADLIGMGRQLMADPEFPNKAKEGRFDEIRPCIATCFGMGRGLEGEERERESQCTLYNCAVNAKGDAEIGAPLKPVTKRKKVFVIGGGPGGMEAAMTAASRGHRVTLYERGDKLGGLLLPGSSPPYKDEIRRLALALETQVKKAGVKVELNTEVTSQLVLDKKPDAVIVATGGKPVVPDIPGVKGKNVVTAIEALKEVAKVGNKVVVIGGGMVGCETAEFLAAKGKEVTLLEMLPKLAIDASSSMRWVLRSRLMEANVTIETSLRAEEITPEGVRGVMEGKTIFYPADTVVLAAGFSPNQELAIQLRDKVSEVHLVGDCVKPRKIYQAIEEGFLAGNKV